MLFRSRGVKKADFENDDDDDDSEQYEFPDDLAASHTSKTAKNYGVTIDVLKRLTAESLEIFGQVRKAVKRLHCRRKWTSDRIYFVPAWENESC